MNRIVFVALTSITLAACADIDPNADGNTVADREAVSTPPPQFSRTYTVDFDYDPSGNAIAIGTAVNNVYAAWGVTFSASYCGNTATCNAASAYANSWGTSGNDVVSLFQRGYAAFDARWGTIEAHFSTPQTRVTIDAYDEVTSIGLTAPTARPWIEAYDASNNLVDRTFGTVSLETWQTLTVTSRTGIARVRFSNEVGSPYVYSAFDNLTFTAPTIVLTRLPSGTVP